MKALQCRYYLAQLFESTNTAISMHAQSKNFRFPNIPSNEAQTCKPAAVSMTTLRDNVFAFTIFCASSSTVSVIEAYKS